MSTFPPSDEVHLKAAEGWLGLGNPQEAEAELNSVSPALRIHPEVLNLHWQICAKAGKWEACIEIAGAQVAASPQHPQGWINRSFALHELNRTQEALELLEPATEQFSDIWLIRYNLACYACQLGDRHKALKSLNDAMSLAEDKQAIMQMALVDKDLEPLWSELSDR